MLGANKVMLQTHKKKYELLQTKDEEGVVHYLQKF